MKVDIVGGGPAGLFLGVLLRRRAPSYDVTVYERSTADLTFGLGIVFGEEAREHLAAADPPTLERISARFHSWSAIECRMRGQTLRCEGQPFSALARVLLLRILRQRAAELGVSLEHRHDIRNLEELADADLIVAADGAPSGVRDSLADAFGPEIRLRRNPYTWFGTTARFDVLTHIFRETPYGRFMAHAYPYDGEHATFVVETSPQTWVRAGLAAHAEAGESPAAGDEASRSFCEEVFADDLHGQPLLADSCRWRSFPVVTCRSWYAEDAGRPVVLVGDAAHTTHFSLGSGTRLAMEDATALADALIAHGGDLPTALKSYEADRRPAIASAQRAAQTSLEWFEGVERYAAMEPQQFFFSLLTRSQRVTAADLSRRDPVYVRSVEEWHAARARATQPTIPRDAPPMFHPLRVRSLELPNRVVVAPLALHDAGAGVPHDAHLVHLGSRAVGGAGMVFTELTAVSPEGRRTPGDCGLWNDEQAAAYARVVAFVHDHSTAKIALQLGHAGRRGAVAPPWAEHAPLEAGWPLLAPSPLPYRSGLPAPREMTAADLDRVREEHVAAARRAVTCGFDWLELHFASGYLLGSFISPLTNQRTDEYGGSLAARMRYPLEVFAAVRAVWPPESPMSVRISADDCAPGGSTTEDGVAVARMLRDAGCDLVDVAAGSAVPEGRPDPGRLFQTPYADRIRWEAGMPTMTQGALSTVDDVNTVLLAGRADLCLMGRVHLIDPYWTLNAALDQGYDDQPWPPAYRRGKDVRRRAQQA